MPYNRQAATKKKKKPLSPKLRQFKKKLLSEPGRSVTAIAMDVYNCKNRRSAAVMGCEAMKQIGISLNDLFEREQLGNEHDVKFIKKMLKAKKVVAIVKPGQEELEKNPSAKPEIIERADLKIQLGAFECLQKMKGRLMNNNRQILGGNHYYVEYGHRQQAVQSSGDSPVRLGRRGESEPAK